MVALCGVRKRGIGLGQRELEIRVGTKDSESHAWKPPSGRWQTPRDWPDSGSRQGREVEEWVQLEKGGGCPPRWTERSGG